MALSIFLFFCFFVLISIVWFTLKNGISPMPTSSKVKKAFLDTLPKTINGDILELGAGWGTLAFALAKRYPNCTVKAYENSWFPYFICKIRQLISPLPNLKFKCQNFFKISFGQSGLVVCYLYPGAMKKLRDKFDQELDQQTLIATHTFSIIGWSPIFSYRVNDLYGTLIYHYRKK